MNSIFILSSVTYALKGQKLLESKKIKSQLTKASNIENIRGCGYGLIVKTNEKNVVQELFSAAGIRIIDIVEETT